MHNTKNANASGGTPDKYGAGGADAAQRRMKKSKSLRTVTGEEEESDSDNSDISGETVSSEEVQEKKWCEKEAILNYLMPCRKKKKSNQVQPSAPKQSSLGQKCKDKDSGRHAATVENDIEMQGDHLATQSANDLDEDKEEEEKKAREDPEIQEYMKKYCEKSLNFFKIDNLIRKNCIRIIESPIFEGLIMMLICANTVQLGSIDYVYINHPLRYTKIPWANEFQQNTEWIFTFLYSMECLIKIIAVGLVVKNGCYLRDGWNWLDFTVVITALLQSIPNMSNVRAIRTFRLLRPLRSLSAVPSMKILMNTLLNSMRQLTNILIVDTFFIMIFAIFGL